VRWKSEQVSRTARSRVFTRSSPATASDREQGREAVTCTFVPDGGDAHDVFGRAFRERCHVVGARVVRRRCRCGEAGGHGLVGPGPHRS